MPVGVVIEKEKSHWIYDMRFLKCFLIGFCLTASGYSLALAQEVSEQETYEDVVVSRGQVQGTDPAMSAFLNGDYETAEIEFKKNYSNLIRQENLAFQALQQTQNNAISQQIINGPPQPGGQGGPSIGSVSPDGFDVRGLNQVAQREEESESRIGSGTDLGYQLYMTGLSQIQLKKYDEAKMSFMRALRRTKTLHDARFRLGLLELRDGNVAEARVQYNRLLKAQERCKSRCDAHQAINEGVEVLGGALAKLN